MKVEDYYRSPAMAEFFSLYREHGEPQGLREGQFFVNHWIVGPWEFLYYQEDTAMSKLLIAQWLQRYQYWDTLPPKIRNFD